MVEIWRDFWKTQRTGKVVDFNYILFDINRYKDEELLKAANLISAVFLMDKKTSGCYSKA